MKKIEINSFKITHTVRIVTVNISILILLLVVLEFIFAVIQTNREISDNLKIKNQNNNIEFPKLTFGAYLFEVKIGLFIITEKQIIINILPWTNSESLRSESSTKKTVLSLQVVHLLMGNL